MRYDVFCRFESKNRPFLRETAIVNLPYLIFGRRVIFPRSESDYEVAMEAFGKAVGRRDIETIMLRRDDDQLSLAKMLILRGVNGWLICDMLMLRLWASGVGVYFAENEFLRECMLCGIRFHDGSRRKASVTVKVGNAFTRVDLVYRDEHSHVTTFTELMSMESRYAGVIMELGHPVSWIAANRDGVEDSLTTTRVYRFAHRVMRNWVLEVDDNGSHEQEKVLLHGLRAYCGQNAVINVNYRLVNVQFKFDMDNLESGRRQDLHLSYGHFHEWLMSYLMPNMRQLQMYQRACRENFLHGVGM